MKKLFYLSVLSIILASCTTQDNALEVKPVLLPVTEVTFPTTFTENVVTEIPVKYALPDGCHQFYDFYYLKTDNTRTVAIIATKVIQDVCTQAVTTETQILKFKPALAGTYKFKFFKGKDAAGVDEYFEYDAVVN